MASDSSSGFFSSPTRGITRFFTDTQNTTKGWKKRTNEQTRTWVSSKRKRREFVALLCSSPCILQAIAGMYLCKTSTKALGMLTHLLTALFCRSVSSAPFCWLFSSALWGCPCGVMVKAMDCGIIVREFVLQSRYYVHFRANTLGKGMNPLIPPSYGLNSTTTVLLGEYLWH